MVANTSTYVTGSKEVTLVDKNDQVLGSLDIFKAHQYPPQLHRASSVWLFRKNDNGQIETLLQQRSQYKPLGAGWWGNAICANVKPGETYQACAYRRLREEIGVERKNVKLQPLYTFHYQAYGNQTYGEHEIDRIFTAKYDYAATPNPQEVSDVIWTPFNKLKTFAQQLTYPTPQQALATEWSELQAMAPPVSYSHSTKKTTPQSLDSDDVAR